MKKNVALIAITALAIYLLMTNKTFAKPTASGLIRGCDKHGCGSFGASRGTRKHDGIDYVAEPGQQILAPISGKVTRFPFPYGTDLSYNGIEIKNNDYTVKIFYMKPSVAIGQNVVAGQVIGTAQDIAKKYSPGMTNHIHIEIRNSQNQLIKFTDLL